MNAEWLVTSGEAVLMVVVSTVGIYAALVLFTRMAGVRSFSKMSSFDFAITVAFGSVFASTVVAKDPPLAQAVAALGALFLLQHAVATFRIQSRAVAGAVDNRPLLIMAGTEILRENLRKARMTEEDLYAKLREANVCRLEQVRAVIAESTGDVSVMHADPDAPPLDVRVLKGVRDVDRLEQIRAQDTSGTMHSDQSGP